MPYLKKKNIRTRVSFFSTEVDTERMLTFYEKEKSKSKFTEFLLRIALYIFSAQSKVAVFLIILILLWGCGLYARAK